MPNQTNEAKIEFEKITNVRLPFDRRHKDDSKNYGIGGLQICFILKGPKGATQFQCYFNHYLPHVASEFALKGKLEAPKIDGWDVGYHSYVPQYDDQSPMGSKCHVLGDKCYYDGSSLRAQTWAEEIFSIKGESPETEIWKRLEQEYMDRFEVSNA